jgi:hypothetical protein
VTIEPGSPLAMSATDAVDRIHAAMSRGDYARVCSTAEPGAFRGASDLPCPGFLAYVHDRLGKLVDAQRARLPSGEDRPAGEPARISLDYTARYENGSAREHFEFRVERSQTTLIGYSIYSDALSQ